jgi:hypothetical protein
MMKIRAQNEAEVLEKVLQTHLKKREYNLVISKADALFDEYKDLGVDAGPIFEPIFKLKTLAAEKLSQIERFKGIAASINILSIVWGERTQSAVLNGVYVMKGDNIAALFGESAPKDLKIVDIKPDRIVIGSEELDLTQEIVFDPASK